MTQNKTYNWQTITLEEFLDLANDTQLLNSIKHVNKTQFDITNEYNLRKVLDSTYSIKGIPKHVLIKDMFSYGIYELHEKLVYCEDEVGKILEFVEAFLSQDELPKAEVLEQFIVWLSHFDTPIITFKLLQLDYFNNLMKHDDITEDEREEIRLEVFYLYERFVSQLIDLDVATQIEDMLGYERIIEQVEYS